jgi:sulfoxide reductase heme-binding subunit YedZ
MAAAPAKAPLAALLPWVPPVLAPRSFAWLRALLFAIALLPFARLVYLTATNDLGANPVEFVLRSLGTWTLVLLCITLTVTPLRLATGWAWLLRLRRMLGLFCFFYASLHMLAFAGLDQSFDLAAIWTEVLDRPYITVGAAAYLLLIPLALTSTNAMVKRLGGRNWQRLHRLVYLIAGLAILHYWWHKAGKNDFAEVSIYAAVVALLLGIRVVRWARSRDRRLPIANR